MRLLVLLLLCSQTWFTGALRLPIRYADAGEVKSLLETLVPDVSFRLDDRVLVCQGSPEALEQVSELVAELDRPPDPVMVEVSLVDTEGVFGESETYGPTMRIESLRWSLLPTLAHTVYRWPPRRVSSDQDAVFELRDDYRAVRPGLALNVKPSLKADGYVVVDVRPEVGTLRETGELDCRSIGTAMRMKLGDLVAIGGLFNESDAIAAFRDDLPNLKAVLGPVSRTRDLALLIRVLPAGR